MSRQINMQKKGAVELQFNWIFVGIAGIIIFIFIISLVIKQKNISDQELNIGVSSQLVTSLKGKQAPNTFTELMIPEATIELRCEDDEASHTQILNIFVDKNPYELDTEIIYSPRKFETSKLYIWTKEFAYPFPITTVMYVTSPQMAYLIYNDTTSAEDDYYVNKLLQDFSYTNITYKYITNTGTDSITFRNYRIIRFDEQSSCPQNTICITPGDAGIEAYGTVRFGPNTNQVKYTTDAMLYGAIFSENSASYECASKRLTKHFEIKRTLMQKRIELLDEGFRAAQKPECSVTTGRMFSASESITRLKSTQQKTLLNFSEDEYEETQSFASANNDLKIASCPVLY